MTDNNGIPFEVKKPFETVQEIDNKYEVPSFEEFMKTYESDERVIDSYYDEFNYYGDIGVPKGYGPGERWKHLCIPCPAKGCSERNKTPKDWVHKRDECRSSFSSYLQWSTEARIKCTYCDNPSHISNWRFRCHRHIDYRKADGEKYTAAISIALRASKIDEDFAQELLDFLEDKPYKG